MNFLELVKARYSARKYANRPVEAEKLDYIMELRGEKRCVSKFGRSENI